MNAIMKQRTSWICIFYKHAQESNCAILFGIVVRLIMCWWKTELNFLGGGKGEEGWLWNDVLGVLLCSHMGED